MNIKEAKEEIRRTVLAYTAKNESGLYRLPQVRKRPVLLMGAPGIGKTAIVEQAAAECGIAFLSYTMTHHTRQSAVGLPLIKEHSFQGKSCSITEYTMSEIIGDVYRVMEGSGLTEGILFLDEINCVSETLMPAMLQFLQYKTFGSHSLPEGWVIVAAGNPVKYNRFAREFDVVTLDRVKYMELEADLDSWREYALSRNIHSSILSYLALKPDNFYVFRHTERGREFVTPRSWEDLSNILETYEALDLPVETSLFPQYLQCEEVSRDFSTYYQLCRGLLQDPVLETITNEGTLPGDCPSFSDIPFDEKLCVIEYLVHSIHRQAASCHERKELLQSLSYAAKGLASCDPDYSKLPAACEELLSRREQAFRKKKEFGLLSRNEEEKEHLLADSLRDFAAKVRIGHLNVSGTSETASDALKQLLAEAFSSSEKEAARLEKVIKAASSFIELNFGDSPETFLFFTELSGHPETDTFLKTRMKGTWNHVQEILSLE